MNPNYHPKAWWYALGIITTFVLSMITWVLVGSVSVLAVAMYLGGYYVIGGGTHYALVRPTFKKLERRSKALQKARELRKAEEDSQLAVWRLMTHLTAADERWLAERHHYVVPREVARIRAGGRWDVPAPSDRYGGYAVPVKNRLDLVEKAKAAEELFKGTALHEVSSTQSDSFQVPLPKHLMPAVSDIQMAMQKTKALAAGEAKQKELAKKKVAPVEGDLVDPPHRTRGSR